MNTAPRKTPRQRIVEALCESPGVTRRAIQFYANNMPLRVVNETLEDLVDSGRVVGCMAVLNWFGRGNGTLFEVHDERAVYFLSEDYDMRKGKHEHARNR